MSTTLAESLHFEHSLRRPIARLIPVSRPEPRAALILRTDIDWLKAPEPYRRQFESEMVQQLSQAIDLLRRLQVEALGDSSRFGYDTLRNAKFHLDRVLREHLTA